MSDKNINNHPAKYWESFKDDMIKCTLCPKFCLIKNGSHGFCGVRKNIDKKLYTIVYNYPIATHVDPIEKKPLFHFLPGTDIFSLGTIGCNLGCKFCQNWDISKAKKQPARIEEITPEKIIEMAKKAGGSPSPPVIWRACAISRQARSRIPCASASWLRWWRRS